MQRQKVGYFDLMRCAAAVAVVAIHVLGPYRYQLGELSGFGWESAIIVNSASRWAVPLFIMISGALLLSDQRAFNLSYYLRRRIGKVLVPFLSWSAIYAVIAGISISGWSGGEVVTRLMALPTQATYYHLGFFYYFIPLYFVVPFFRYLCQQCDSRYWQGLLLLWAVGISANLFRIDGIWSHDLFFYSGYLLLGYGLFQFPRRDSILLWMTLILIVVGVTAYMVIDPSLENGRYTVGRWLSYKTINTAFIAAGVFIVCQQSYSWWSAAILKHVSTVSQYSLGIYLLHPLFLWPVREWDLYIGHPLAMIVGWTLLALYGALVLTRWLASKPSLAWLVP